MHTHTHTNTHLYAHAHAHTHTHSRTHTHTTVARGIESANTSEEGSTRSCSMLQSVVLRCVAVRCALLRARREQKTQWWNVRSVRSNTCVTVCCSLLLCATVCCYVLQRVAVFCDPLFSYPFLFRDLVHVLFSCCASAASWSILQSVWSESLWLSFLISVSISCSVSVSGFESAFVSCFLSVSASCFLSVSVSFFLFVSVSCFLSISVGVCDSLCADDAPFSNPSTVSRSVWWACQQWQ